MLVLKRKFTQLILIISTFTSFTKLAKVKVAFNDNNYYFGFLGMIEKSPDISAQNQQEMAEPPSTSKSGGGLLAYLNLGAFKGVENRKIKISKGSLHLFKFFLDPEEFQKSGINCLFEKPPLAFWTNDEDLEYTLPSSSESSVFLGEVKFSGPANKSYLNQLNNPNATEKDLDLGEDAQMVLLRGYKANLTLENIRLTTHNDGSCSLFLDESTDTILRMTSFKSKHTILEMGITNRVTGEVLDKAIKFKPSEEFDEEWSLKDVPTTDKDFVDFEVIIGTFHWSNTGENKPAAGGDNGPIIGEDNGLIAGEEHKPIAGGDNGPIAGEDESLFSKAIFWVFFIYKNVTKKKYVVSRTSSPRAQKA